MIWSPVEIAFNLEAYALNYVIEIIFILDIFANTIVAQVIESDHTVGENSLIYFKGWFWIDAPSSVPSTWLEYFYDVGNDTTAGTTGTASLKFVKALKVMRLMRIVRIVKISRTTFSVISSSSAHVVTPALRKMLLLVFYFVVYVHYTSCLYWAIGLNQEHEWFPCSSGYWQLPIVGARRVHVGFPRGWHLGFPFLYWEAFHVSLSILLGEPAEKAYMPHPGTSYDTAECTGDSTADGDASLYNKDLLLYSSIFQFVGVFVMAFVIGGASATYANMNSAEAMKFEHIGGLMRYLKSRNVPSSFRQHVGKFYGEWWDRGHGLNKMLATDGLPVDLKIQMRVAAKRNVVYNFAPFKDLAMHGGEKGNRAILELIDELQTRLYDEGSCIVCEGEFGSEVFFITYGFVTVSTAADGEMNKLRKGAVFGESVLFVENPPPRFATIKSSCSFLEVEVLHKDSFHYLEQRHPVFNVVHKALRHTHSRRSARARMDDKVKSPALAMRGIQAFGDILSSRLQQSKKNVAARSQPGDGAGMRVGAAGGGDRERAEGGSGSSRGVWGGMKRRWSKGAEPDEDCHQEPQRGEQRAVSGAANAHPLPMGELTDRLGNGSARR
jgi:hypothetical protein